MASPIPLRGPYLTAARRADPEQWREAVREALRSTGSTVDAAKSLGVTRKTINAWLREDPTLTDGIELRRNPGRPSLPRK